MAMAKVTYQQTHFLKGNKETNINISTCIQYIKKKQIYHTNILSITHIQRFRSNE